MLRLLGIIGAWFLVYLCVCLGALIAAPAAEECKISERVQWITLDKSQYPHVVAQIRRSWRLGYPRVLSVRRLSAEERHEALLGQRVKGRLKYPPREGFRRVQVPAANLRHKPLGARVAYVPLGEARRAEDVVQRRLDGLCDRTEVRYRFVP